MIGGAGCAYVHPECLALFRCSVVVWWKPYRFGQDVRDFHIAGYTRALWLVAAYRLAQFQPFGAVLVRAPREAVGLQVDGYA